MPGPHRRWLHQLHVRLPFKHPIGLRMTGEIICEARPEDRALQKMLKTSGWRHCHSLNKPAGSWQNNMLKDVLSNFARPYLKMLVKLAPWYVAVPTLMPLIITKFLNTT